MEEKKNIKMEAVKTGKDQDKKQQKLSYEQLNEVCMQLYQQNQKLTQQLQQANMTNMFARLDYLFKVLNYESVIKDAEFINSCIAEIKEAMIIKSEEEPKED